MPVALTPLDIPLTFSTAVDLIVAVDRLRAALSVAETDSDLAREASDAIPAATGAAFDVVVTEANRLKRALGASGPLTPSEKNRHPGPVRWPLYDGQFADAAHPASVRNGLVKLAAAAIDVSGYAQVVDGVPFFLDRGERLLRWGVGQLWRTFSEADREALARPSVTADGAGRWPPASGDADLFNGPDDLPDEDHYRIVDKTNGYYARSPSYVDQISVAGTRDQVRPERTPLPTPYHGPEFSADDFRRAGEALEHILQDDPPATNPARVVQSELVERLRGRGITRALANRFIEELIDRQVLSVDGELVNLQTHVPFHGEQSDRVERDRRLALDLDRWYRYTAETRSDPEAAGTVDRLIAWHGLAVLGLNAIVRLQFLPYVTNWPDAGRALVARLAEVAAGVPDVLPPEDPFAGEAAVEIAGTMASSSHAAALLIVRKTWDSIRIRQDAESTTSEHRDESGRPSVRIDTPCAWVSPLEVPWDQDVWREVSARVAVLPQIDEQRIEAALTVEVGRARRWLEARFGPATAAMFRLPVARLTHPEPRPQVRLNFDCPLPRVPEPTAPATSGPAANVFRYSSEQWEVSFDGTRVSIPARTGHKYLAELIRQKGKEVHVLRLRSLASERPTGGQSGGDAVLDDRALREYWDRFAELAEAEAAAKRDNDLGRIAELEREREALDRELRSTLDGRGHARPLGDLAERARKSVSKAIERAIDDMADRHCSLHRHLDQSIRTGTFMAYEPDPDVSWEA
jgi:hypothetical protein